ncbi:uncharacterized protein LOC113531477 [Pangasianodon hypophthalmus]|uniref:uncharacterized protein LOC113531477 n=1 Tax=Pangasianodon hypophthalmus TaxID=310915 RepID=UPI002307F1EE|nr:uncharacterized protein LOC113531477 [Pangasianodon hypophthalmus]
MAWCRTALWIWLLTAVYERCCSSPSSFSKSLSLTRAVRSRVQQLLLRYKEEQFGDTNFDDKRIVLKTLPTVTINYRTWLQMEDTERLYRASHDLQSFWTHLESQRQKLQGNSGRSEGKEMKKRNRRGRPCQSLSQSILGIQLDLRDLMRQVNSQVCTHKIQPCYPFALSSQLLSINTLKKDDYTHTPPSTTTTSSSTSRPSVPSTSTSTSTVSPPGSTLSALDLILSSTLRTTAVPSVTQPRKGEPSPGTVQENTPKAVSSQWMSVLEGYVILRDLERYLSRLVRDYTLLRAKY